MTLPHEPLERLLRKVTFCLRMRSLLNFIGMAFVWLLFLAILDYRIRPELSLLRYSLTLLCFVPVLCLLVWGVIPQWRYSPRLEELALAVDEILGYQRSELSSLVSIDSTDIVTPGESSSFQKIHELWELNPASTVSIRTLRLYLQLILLILLMALSCLLYPVETSISFNRLIRPHVAISWPQRTRLQIFDYQQNPITPGAVKSVADNRNNQFFVIDSIGAPPKELILEVRRSNNHVRRVLLRGQKQSFRDTTNIEVFDFRIVLAPGEQLEFRITGDDAVSMPWTTLMHVVKPALRGISCEISPPDYLSQQPEQIKNWSGLLKVPAGAQIDFELGLNRSVDEMQIIDQSNAVIYQNQVKSDQSRFSWKDDGHGESLIRLDIRVRTNGIQEDEWQRIKVLQIETIPDQPPLVELITPDRNLTATRKAVIPLKAVATDDHGLSSLSVVIRSADEFVLPLENLSGEPEAELNGVITIANTQSQLGDQLEIWAQAVDFWPGRLMSKTEKSSITIVSEPDKTEELNGLLQQVAQTISLSLTNQQELITLHQSVSRSLSTQNSTTFDRATYEVIRSRQQELLERLRELFFEESVPLIRKELEYNKLTEPRLISTIKKTEQLFQKSLQPALVQVIATIDLLLDKSELENQAVNSLPNDPVQQVGHAQLMVVQDFKAMLLILDEWLQEATVQNRWQLVQVHLQSIISDLEDFSEKTALLTRNELTEEQQATLEQLVKQHSKLIHLVQELKDLTSTKLESKWSVVYRYLTDSSIDLQLKTAQAAARQNNSLKAIQIDKAIFLQLNDLQSQLSQYDSQRLAESILMLESLGKELDRQIQAQERLRPQWLSESPQEWPFTQQEQILQDFRGIAETIRSLGIPGVAESVSKYNKGAAAVLETTLATHDSTLIDHQIDYLVEIQGFMLSLVKKNLRQRQEQQKQRDLTRLTDVITALASEFKQVSEKLKSMVDAQETSGRLTRSQRRELLQIAQILEAGHKQLFPFLDNTFIEVALWKNLNLVVNQLQDLAQRLRSMEVTPLMVDSVHEIQRLLLSLIRSTSETLPSDTDPSTRREKGSLLEKLMELQERQTALIAEESAILKKSTSLTIEQQHDFQQRQSEIHHELNDLLKSIQIEEVP